MAREAIEPRWQWAKRYVATVEVRDPQTLLRDCHRLMMDAAHTPTSSINLTESTSVASPPNGWADPWLLGAIHEQAVTMVERRKRGAWYTPPRLVAGLARFAFAGASSELIHLDDVPIVDPACGGGAFLLAVADYLAEAGLDPNVIFRRLHGNDVDPLAAKVSQWSLEIWAACRGVDTRTPDRPKISCADALQHWPLADGQRQLVIGNPPFASPLRAGAIPDVAERYRLANEDLLGPYADLAAIHLLRAYHMVGPRSTVVLVQPQSVLSSRDTQPLREHLDDELAGLWVAREAVFDAGVRACAPKLVTVGASAGPSNVLPGDSSKPGFKKARPDKVQLASGTGVDVHSSAPNDGWPRLAADALGAPRLPKMTRCLADKGISATAGFRDEYYGLAARCVEHDGDPAYHRLITVGMIDPLENMWGRSEIKFAQKRWRRPAVRPSELDPKVKAWTERQLQPKLLVATQAKVLEPILDPSGTLIPVTPVISVHADVDELAHIAAVLLAPPVVAWAWRTWFGSAMSVNAVKLSAKQVLQLPLPRDQVLWDQAAKIIHDDHGLGNADRQKLTAEVAAIMTRAYGADGRVLQWWMDRR